MKVLILGNDGYLGHALSVHLTERGHDVWGFDNRLRRRLVERVGGNSIIPLRHATAYGELTDALSLAVHASKATPDVIVHFAEQPSAPFSLRSVYDAVLTQENNIGGTMNLLWWMRENAPNAHLIKLGSMGVYGTPDWDIPETDGPIAYDPGSFYHISKAADSLNVRKACEWWGLNATDIHQGVVYGNIHDTRLDYDSYFGTVLNRFIAQATVDIPLTVYGTGGQRRGFINIRDTMQCIAGAMHNPPKGYRVYNQFTELFSVQHIAEMVAQHTGSDIQHLDPPRKEMMEHRYNPTHKRIPELGIEVHRMIEEIPILYSLVGEHQNRINKEVIMPQTRWGS